MEYQGTRVLVTGGLGFIGSALAAALVERGARVRVLDSLLPHFGGSPRNLGSVAGQVEVILEDTRNRDAVNRAVEATDVVFHLAAPAGPGVGAGDFYTDLDVACLGTWHVLEGMRIYAPGARLVFASSHFVYARDCPCPVAEDAALRPDTLFGAHKLAGEQYVGVYHVAHGMDTVVARLTSVFGPGQRLQSAGSGSLGRALEAALHGEELPIYNGGSQVGDHVFVTDAVEALLTLGQLPAARGLTVNVGSGRGVTLRAAAETVIKAVGRGGIRDVRLDGTQEGPGAREFVADTRRLGALGAPVSKRSFEEAVQETATWYRGDAE